MRGMKKAILLLMTGCLLVLNISLSWVNAGAVEYVIDVIEIETPNYEPIVTSEPVELEEVEVVMLEEEVPQISYEFEDEHECVFTFYTEVEPTHTTEGSSYKECDICGMRISPYIIPKTSEHTSSDWIIESEPTCTSKGSSYRKCTECGEILERSSTAELGHNYKDIIVKESTATERGIIRHECVNCKDSYETKIPLKICYEHAWKKKAVIKKCTCIADGKEKYECVICGEIKYEIIPANKDNHEILDTYTEVVNEGSETEERVVVSHCGHCHEILNTYTYPPYTTKEIELKDGETTTVYGYYDEDLSRQVFDLLNEYRVANGLNELNWADEISSCADLRAAEAAVSFGHVRPNGEKWYLLNISRLNGENLAMGYQTAQSVMTAWKNSPTHNENLLFPKFNSVAISCFVKYEILANGKVSKKYLFAQNFSMRK